MGCLAAIKQSISYNFRISDVALILNSISSEKADYRSKRLRLVMDLVMLDLWSNKAFKTFFKETMKEEVGVCERNMSSKEILDMLSIKQADLVDKKSQVCSDGSHI